MHTRIAFYTSFFVLFFGWFALYAVANLYSLWWIVFKHVTDISGSGMEVYVIAASIGGLSGLLMGRCGSLRRVAVHLWIVPLGFHFGYIGDAPIVMLVYVYFFYMLSYLLLFVAAGIEYSNEEEGGGARETVRE